MSFILLIGILLISLHNINKFMISEKKCEPGFNMINKCGCIPDENLSKLFGIKHNYTQISANES